MKAEMTRNADEQQIREVIDSQTAALSSKDVKGAIEGYAKGNVMYTMAPPLRPPQRDEKEATGAVQEWFDTWDGPLRYETDDLQVTVSGDLAFSTGLFRMIGTQQGKNVDIWYRRTLVFQRIDGEWKIVHDHQSVPFYMDGSFRAAVDLKP